MIYSFAYFFIFIFFAVLTLYPFIYIKSLNTVLVSPSGCSIRSVRYKNVKHLSRCRLNNYYILFNDTDITDKLLPTTYYIFTIGYLGKLRSVDPSSDQFKSFEKNYIKGV